MNQSLGDRIRDVLARSGVPSEVALREWADQADALQRDRDKFEGRLIAANNMNRMMLEQKS